MPATNSRDVASCDACRTTCIHSTTMTHNYIVLTFVIVMCEVFFVFALPFVRNSHCWSILFIFITRARSTEKVFGIRRSSRAITFHLYNFWRAANLWFDIYFSCEWLWLCVCMIFAAFMARLVCPTKENETHSTLSVTATTTKTKPNKSNEERRRRNTVMKWK